MPRSIFGRCVGGVRIVAVLAALSFAIGAPAAEPGFARLRPDQNQSIGLRSGTVDTSVSRVSFADLKREAWLLPGTRAVVQLDGPMDARRRERLEQAGVKIDGYLPPNAFIVDLEAADAGALARMEFIRWRGRYQREWKLDPDIGLRPYATVERQEEARAGRVSVEVHLFDGGDANEVADAIRALPGAVVASVNVQDGVASVSASMPINAAALLADLPQVAFVEDAAENTPRSNTNNRWIVQSNVSAFTPVYNNGIRGEGQVIGVIDSALDINHCSFRDSVNNTPGPSHRKVLAYNAAFGASSHGTHVSGTAAGDGGADDNTRGVAYLAKIVYNSIPSPQNETNITNRLSLHYSQGARVHTNSWGDDGTTLYTGQCRGIDAHTWANEDSVVAFAITNTSTLKTPENAKNCLAVAATQPSPNQQNFCSGGAGPTNDGRRKPEVMAPGCSTVSSSAGSSCGTTTMTGTSMACPAVAGAAILVRQYFLNGYYPSGAANPPDGFNPSAALVRATLMNSAVDMTGITGYPSNTEGWGRVLLDNALYFPGDVRRLIVRDVWRANGLSTGDVWEQQVVVGTNPMPFKVVLVWTEPPAAVNANPAYINNLNLEVVAPGDVLYYGNNFVSGQSSPGGSPDFRNNAEVVLLNTPAAGTYTLRVRATAVNTGPQGYALVATGDVAPWAPPPPPPCMGDANGNGVVDFADITDVLGAWGGTGPRGDADHNGTVNFEDITTVLTNFGNVCP